MTRTKVVKYLRGDLCFWLFWAYGPEMLLPVCWDQPSRTPLFFFLTFQCFRLLTEGRCVRINWTSTFRFGSFLRVSTWVFVVVLRCWHWETWPRASLVSFESILLCGHLVRGSTRLRSASKNIYFVHLAEYLDQLQTLLFLESNLQFHHLLGEAHGETGCLYRLFAHLNIFLITLQAIKWQVDKTGKIY